MVLLPACAEACPVEAIQFGKRNDLTENGKTEDMGFEPDKYIDHVYGETEAGGTGWLYVSKLPFEKMGFPGNIGTTSYPETDQGFPGYGKSDACHMACTAWRFLYGDT